MPIPPGGINPNERQRQMLESLYSGFGIDPTFGMMGVGGVLEFKGAKRAFELGEPVVSKGVGYSDLFIHDIFIAGQHTGNMSVYVDKTEPAVGYIITKGRMALENLPKHVTPKRIATEVLRRNPLLDVIRDTDTGEVLASKVRK